jgi:hypothetical protein
MPKFMNANIKIAFLMLVLIQGMHSIEEYFGKLWKVFQPAKILSSLVSNNLETGFLIINIGLFIFGIWSWAIPVRKDYSIARIIIWIFIVIELINGIGHPIWAIYERSYVPGVATAPILLILAVYLFNELRKT